MPVTQQYWRITCTANGSSVESIADVKFFDTNNNVISLAGGTATASSSLNGSTLPANAFDGNPATLWASSASSSVGSPQWLQYQFTGAVPVVALSIQITNDNSFFAIQAPQTFVIASSPDGITWTTQNTVTGFTWRTASQIAFFTASTVVGHLRLSQNAIEVVYTPPRDLKLTQLNVETLLNAEPRAKITQLNVETLLNAEPRAKISQIYVEIIYPFVQSAPANVQQFLLP